MPQRIPNAPKLFDETINNYVLSPVGPFLPSQAVLLIPISFFRSSPAGEKTGWASRAVEQDGSVVTSSSEKTSSSPSCGDDPALPVSPLPGFLFRHADVEGTLEWPDSPLLSLQTNPSLTLQSRRLDRI